MIVQALDPSARALELAARHDSETFLAGELQRRALLGYPPHGSLIRIVCSAAEAGPELDAARAVGERIAAEDVPVLGPAPLFRRQSRHRAQLLIRSRERAAAIVAVREAVEAAAAERAHAAVSFAVDVDPQ